MNNVVWTIAGSDSGGGAGIQADIKAMQSFGVHGCTAITALTAQNSLGVEAINAVSTDIIESQLLALEKDMKAKVIKIGMLANVQQIQLISEHISHYKAKWSVPPVIVYDPVAIRIGLRPGDLCKIYRPSTTSIISVYYRYCCN